jgi:hypothetical protein
MKKFSEKLYKTLHEKNALQRKIARNLLFRIGERFGFHIVGDHFYEPVPNLKLIRETYDGTVRQIPGMPLDLSEIGQAHAARLGKYGAEFMGAAGKWGYVERNHYFRGADALALYCFVREMRIMTIVEVGQGFSSRVACAALERNGMEYGERARFVTIDPYQRLPEELNGNDHVDVSIVRQQVQSIDRRETLGKLGCQGLLFVDSSHVYKFGSDVEFLMRNIYPFVPSGTYIHVHDVCTPCPWPAEFYTKFLWFWNEQDFLETFLACNADFEVLLPVYWVCRDSDPVKAEMGEWKRKEGFATTGYGFYLRRK